MYLGAMLGSSGQLQGPGLTQDIQNSDKFRTLPYSQPSYIENLHVYKILADLEP